PSDPMRDQPITQRDEFGGVGAERLCLTAAVATLREPHRRHHRVAVHIQTRAELNYLIHQQPPYSRPQQERRLPEEGRRSKESEVRARSSTTGCPQPSAPYFFPGSRAPSGVGVSPAAAVISISRPGQHRNTDERHQRRILISLGAPAQPGPSILFSKTHGPNVIRRFHGASAPTLRVHQHP